MGQSIPNTKMFSIDDFSVSRAVSRESIKSITVLSAIQRFYYQTMHCIEAML